jgi:uncharacterized glyoxalase superfamily protein PhnB
MTVTTSQRFSRVIPILNVRDVASSIEHYTRVLGFTLHWDWPRDQSAKTFASLCHGQAELFLCQGEQGAAGTWLYYDVEDVDGLHQQYRAAGAELIQAPTDRPWGMREMLVRDIDGHVLRIGQPIGPE